MKLSNIYFIGKIPEYGDDLLRGGLGPAEQLQHAVLHCSEAARPGAQGDLVPAHDITVNLRWSLLSQCNVSFEALVIPLTLSTATSSYCSTLALL